MRLCSLMFPLHVWSLVQFHPGFDIGADVYVSDMKTSDVVWGKRTRTAPRFHQDLHFNVHG